MKIKLYLIILSILSLEISESYYLYSMNSNANTVSKKDRQKKVKTIYDAFKKNYLANFEFDKEEKKEKSEIIALQKTGSDMLKLI